MEAAARRGWQASRQAASGAPRERNSPGPPSAYTILQQPKASGASQMGLTYMHLLAGAGQQQAASPPSFPRSSPYGAAIEVLAAEVADG